MASKMTFDAVIVKQWVSESRRQRAKLITVLEARSDFKVYVWPLHFIIQRSLMRFWYESQFRELKYGKK